MQTMHIRVFHKIVFDTFSLDFVVSCQDVLLWNTITVGHLADRINTRIITPLYDLYNIIN